MAQLERKYIIPLRKEWQKVPIYKRTQKAITALQQFLQKHMKVEEVKIGKFLNKKIWERGMKKPPHKIEVLARRIEEKDHTYVIAELPDAPKEEKQSPEKMKRKKLTEKVKEVFTAPEDKEAAEAKKAEAVEEKKLLKKDQEHKAEQVKEPHKKQKAEAKKDHKEELIGHTGKKGGVETTGRH